jgi:hypothetical protein
MIFLSIGSLLARELMQQLSNRIWNHSARYNFSAKPKTGLEGLIEVTSKVCIRLVLERKASYDLKL